MNKFLILFFSFVFSANFHAQLGELDRFDCTFSKEITIPFNYSESSNNVKPNLNQIVFYSHRDQFTYWYKISCKTDTKISFKAAAINDSDDYAVYVYQYNNLDFCNKVYSKKIKPIMGPNYIEKSNNLNTINFKSFAVKKDNIYYISIVNTSLNNCGHYFLLSNNKDSLKVKALHSPCKKDISVVETLVESKTKQNINTDTLQKIVPEAKLVTRDTSLLVQITKDTISNFSKLTCYVKDKNKLTLIQSQLTVINQQTKENVPLINKGAGVFELIVQNTSAYKLKCTAFGYKELEQSLNLIIGNKVELLLEPLKVGDNFIMKSIYFHANTYALRKESTTDLQKLLNFMLENPSIVIEIQGHTNGNHHIYKNKAYKTLGDEWYFSGSSKKLSLSRAKAINRYLVSNGVNANRLVCEGKGGKKPIIGFPETMAEAQTNIRVEIVILKN